MNASKSTSDNTKSSTRKNKKPTFTEIARKKQILDAAFKLFSKKGYDQTSVEDIAAKVGGSRSVIFYYFEGKREVGEAVVRKGLTAYSKYVNKRVGKKSTAKAKLIEFVSACIDYTQKHRSDYLVYIDTMGRFASVNGKMNFLRHVNDETRALLIQLIEQGQAEGDIREMPAQDLADIIQGSVDGLMALFSVQPEKVDLDGCRNMLTGMISKTLEP